MYESNVSTSIQTLLPTQLSFAVAGIIAVITAAMLIYLVIQAFGGGPIVPRINTKGLVKFAVMTVPFIITLLVGYTVINDVRTSLENEYTTTYDNDVEFDNSYQEITTPNQEQQIYNVQDYINDTTPDIDNEYENIHLDLNIEELNLEDI